MPYLTFQMRVTGDYGGSPAVVFERTVRLFLTEAQMLAVTKAGGDTPGVYTAIPTVDKLPALNALVIATDQPLNFKLASVGAADGIIAMKQGGILAVIDCNIAAGAALNALVNNTGTTAAN